VPHLQVDLEEVFVAVELLAELALEVEDLVVEDLLVAVQFERSEMKKDSRFDILLKKVKWRERRKIC
jgi:hypothetical protein